MTADPIPAGDFGSWLDRTRAAIDGDVDADVPCDGCTACCTSAQFVHIGPDETDTLAHIPPDLLFPAPLRPKGHVVLGFDEHGRCPMLADAGCSIYAHRPRTCRTYDCRVFPASGLEPVEETKVAIADRARRWHFTYADDEARARHGAVRAAAAYLTAHPDLVGEHAPTPTLLAVLAVEVHRAFLTVDELGAPLAVDDPAPDVVRSALAALARRGLAPGGPPD